jgi:hypothetical protein
MTLQHALVACVSEHFLPKMMCDMRGISQFRVGRLRQGDKRRAPAIAPEESMPYDQHLKCSDDRAYYARRSDEEAERAKHAVTPEAKRTHSDLAALFKRKAADAGAE